MIKSMTGFGRCEFADENRKFTVEIKAVNHRYLDVNIKMPKKLNFFESAIRTLLKEYMERGKVDIFINCEDYTQDNVSLKYNEALAAQYLTYLNSMAEKFGLDNDIRVSTLSKYPDVFTMEEQGIDEKSLWLGLEKAIRGAAEQFVESRIREGEHLKKDLCEKLDGMLSYVDFIEERSPVIMKEYKERLEAKVAGLRSHIKSTKDTLEAGGSVGRKLDFIAQEMNREANTILSKTNDLAISDIGISLKTDIEKVREQIQNIE